MFLIRPVVFFPLPFHYLIITPTCKCAACYIHNPDLIALLTRRGIFRLSSWIIHFILPECPFSQVNLNTTPYLMSRTVFFLDTSASESYRGGGAELISVLRMLFLHCTLAAPKMVISGRRFTAVLVRGLPLVAELNHCNSV